MSDEKIEEIQKRRAEKREAKEKAEKEQFVTDLEALESLEDEFGKIVSVKLDFSEGFPTRVFLRAPKRAEYQRYRDLVGKATQQKNTKGVTEAQDQFAKSVWVYPAQADQQAREALLEKFPGVLGNILLEALKLAEGKAEAEGKG